MPGGFFFGARGVRVPSRVIRGDLLSSESLSRVSLEAEAFFARLILVVDDYGRFDARPLVIRSRAYPLRDVTLAQIDAWLIELEHADGDSGPVQRYAVGGRDFLRLVNWERHRGKAKRGSSSLFPGPESGGSSIETGSARGSPRTPADPRPRVEGRGARGEGRRTRGASPPSGPPVVRSNTSSPTKGGSGAEPGSDALASPGAGGRTLEPGRRSAHPRRARVGSAELPKMPDAGRTKSPEPESLGAALANVFASVTVVPDDDARLAAPIEQEPPFVPSASPRRERRTETAAETRAALEARRREAREAEEPMPCAECSAPALHLRKRRWLCDVHFGAAAAVAPGVA